MEKTNLYCKFALVILLLSVYVAQAQMDTEFWFAPPEFTQGSNYLDRPIKLKLASTKYVTQVSISQPANNQFVPINITLQPNSVQYVDLTQRITYLGSAEKFANLR